MKTKIKNYQIFSIFFTFILGTLLHFTYDLSNENPIIAIFSAVNESTWEHLKLLFFPMLLTTIIGYFYIGKNIKNFLCSKTIGIIIAILFLIIFNYTILGILGKNIAFINISSFFVAVILGEFVAYIFIINSKNCSKKLAVFILIVLLFSFAFFTYFPPKLAIFQDPVNFGYGIGKVFHKFAFLCKLW